MLKGKSFLIYQVLSLIFALTFSYIVYAYYSLDPFYFDENRYRSTALNMLEHGLFSKSAYTSVTTYGYPFFIFCLLKIINFFKIKFGIGLGLKEVIFYSQLGIYLVAAFYIRNILAKHLTNEKIATWVFAALCFNPFILSSLTFCLTESLSLVLYICVIGIMLEIFSNPTQTKKLNWSYLLLGFVIGFAIEVRPVNLYLIFVALPFCYFAGYQNVLLFLAGIILAFCPQLYINIKNFSSYTPLVVHNLAGFQSSAGLSMIKYGTSVAPNFAGGIEYLNPFIHKSSTPEGFSLSLFLYNIKTRLLTSMLHVFAVIDQDLFFTYAKDLTPWYRWPSTILSLLVAGLGATGFMIHLSKVFITNTAKTALVANASYKKLLLAILLIILANIAIYSQTASEMRFGLVLLALFSLFIPFARDLFLRNKYLFLLITIIYLAMGIWLSHWIQKQAPIIHQYQEAVSKLQSQ